MEPPLPLSEQDELIENNRLVFALLALPGSLPGRFGRILAGCSDGLSTSQDGGQSWIGLADSLGLTGEVPITCLAGVKVDDRRVEVYAGAPGGLFHSLDGGTQWRLALLPSPPPTVSALAVSPSYQEDSTLFIGTVEDGLFISRDAGRTFVTWNFGLLDLKVISLAVSPGFSQDETLFAGTETGLFRSTNGGRAWREIELPFGYDAVLSLALSPDFCLDKTGRVYAGTEANGLWISSDGGDSWTRLAEAEISGPVNALLNWPNGPAVQTDSGLFVTDQQGGWKNILPDPGEEREAIAILDLPDLAAGGETLVSFTDGSVEVVRLISDIA